MVDKIRAPARTASTLDAESTDRLNTVCLQWAAEEGNRFLKYPEEKDQQKAKLNPKAIVKYKKWVLQLMGIKKNWSFTKEQIAITMEGGEEPAR